MSDEVVAAVESLESRISSELGNIDMTLNQILSLLRTIERKIKK